LKGNHYNSCMSIEKLRPSRRELLSVGVGAILGAGALELLHRRSRRKKSTPAILSLDWEIIPYFRDESIRGVHLAHDPEAQPNAQSTWHTIGIIGVKQALTAPLEGEGKRLAVAYQDPGKNWHVGAPPEGQEFAIFDSKDGESYRVAALRVGAEAPHMTFAAVSGDTFAALPTEIITQTTDDRLPKQQEFKHIPIS